MKMSAEQFLTEFLNIPSVNGRDDERQAAYFIGDFLKEAGLDVRIQEIDDSHANVISVLEGKTKDVVIWNGHLDTVPYGKPEEWNTDPSKAVRIDDRLYARGASDMKSGLAGMAYVLASMKEQNDKPEKTILFCATCDEERGGLGAARLLEYLKKDQFGTPSLMLIGEPTNMRPGIAQKGCIWLRLCVHGKTSHGAYPEQGINAVEYGIKIFEDLKKKIEAQEHALLGHSTVQITGISGGIAPNMTPDAAEIRLDIRVVPGITTDQILTYAREYANDYTNQKNGFLKVEIKLENDRRALEIPEDNEWVCKIKKQLEMRKKEIKPIGINFFSDASILVRGFPQTPVLLFGPGESELAHQPNESVLLSNYVDYIELLRQLF